MINMVRDPRGGRDWETFGEDPYLAANMSVAYCLGVQSVSCIADTKHFICNDMETNRSGANAYSSSIGERTLREIYAMPFEYSVKEAKPWSTMSAYNKVNGQFCSDYPHMLTDILKTDWGFRGFVWSDWNSVQSTIAAANAGQDVEMPGSTYFGTALQNAVALGQVNAARLTDMARRVVRAKVWAGSSASSVPRSPSIPDILKPPTTRNLPSRQPRNRLSWLKTSPSAPYGARAAAQQKREGGGSRAVCAGGATVCRRKRPDLPILLDSTPTPGSRRNSSRKSAHSSQWRSADVVIAVLGVSGEGEGSDRSTATLEPPSGQVALVNSIIAAGKKCVVVLTGGSAAVQDAWASAPAVVVAWYPGEEQGHALAAILFGDVNPSGRLSATWPASVGQLPPFSTGTNNLIPYEGPDTGRGYRYYDRCNLTPLYPFGQGLSYTTFQYSNMVITPNPAFAGESVYVSVDIQNTGAMTGDEVPQLYVSEAAPTLPRPVKEMRGFARVTLTPGQTQTVTFVLRERELACFDTTRAAITSYAPYGRFVAQPDNYTIMVGPSSANLPLSGTLTLAVAMVKDHTEKKSL